MYIEYDENKKNKEISQKIESIPIICNQLKSVIAQTEEAADGIITEFLEVNKRARNQSSAVENLFGSITKECGNNDISDLNNINKNLLLLEEHFERIVSMLSENKVSAEELNKQAESVKSIVERNEEISENARVLAINAAIEAARAGKHGRGFSVVANEFKKLTQDSEESTMEIRSIVDELISGTNIIRKHLIEAADEGEETGQYIKNSIEKATDSVTETIEKATSELSYISQEASKLSNSISSIVMSIQFQDITRQRIEHAIEPLMELYTELKSVIEGEKVKKSYEEENLVDFKWLEDRYTMNEEREILESYSKQ